MGEVEDEDDDDEEENEGAEDDVEDEAPVDMMAVEDEEQGRNVAELEEPAGLPVED